MSIFINHCWCSDSNWGGIYDCRVIVTIDRIAEGKTYYDPPTIDWTSLIEEIPLEWKQFGDRHRTFRLKPEVLTWLNDNIKDRKKLGYRPNVKGWGVGTDVYNSNNPIGFAVFFERTSDAFKFVKQWSSLKKPVDYCNRFSDVRKKLNFKTMTLQKIVW